MDNYILTGCDLHDNSMVLKIAHNDQAPYERRFGGDLEARQKMIA
jgi:transposase